MAIVKMTKIKLIALGYHKDKILNALHKTGCVELSDTEELPDTFVIPEDETLSALNTKIVSVTRAVDFVTEVLEKSKGKPYAPAAPEFFNELFLSYDEFMSTPKREEIVWEKVAELKDFESEISRFRSERIKLNNFKNLLTPYAQVNQNFSHFKDTEKTAVFLGTVKKEQIFALKRIKEETEFVEIEILAENQISVVSVVCLKDCAEQVGKILSEAAFYKCPFVFDATAQEKIAETDKVLKAISKREEEIYSQICKQDTLLKELKIVSDYYTFLAEKQRDGDRFRHTGSTFVLEGYLPEEKQNEVKSAVQMVSDAVFIEFSEPKEGDEPPTLTKNDKLVTQTEFITDLYSTPDYNEVDPNKVVFFFFMLFMGVIMADIGYGLVMIVLGLTLALRIKVDNGARRLWFVIALGGVFSIIFGVLFNSLFGVRVLPFDILPSPVPENGNTEGLMTILLGCLALGVIHIATGYFMKALNCFKQKDYVGGIFDGLVWVLFFIGFIFAAFNFLVGYLMPEALETMNPAVKNFFDAVTVPGLVIVGVTVVMAAFTAGRNERGFGKFSKGFGAVYGLINLMSDILSYARLFGLMLSGMIIASTFNDIGGSLLSGGGIGYVFGPLVMGLGHTFNIAMGVLGAYIHDSRLQYIEFFSKFYTGEGEKFMPLGSDMKYIYLTK